MKKVILFLVASFILAGAVGTALSWYTFSLRPLDSSGQEKLIGIDAGLSTREIGKKLQQSGIIRSELAFYINVRLHDDLLQAGTYRLSPAMSVNDIVTKLASGDVAEHRITIPEGRRLTEIAKQLAEAKIVSAEDFLKAAAGKEGYLFPDTYTFPLSVNAAGIVKAMRGNFDTRTDKSNLVLKRADIILASIIEREAKNDEERAQIAAVYKNRLRIGMRLEADPTVQYAKTLVDTSITDPWPKITVDDYRAVISPYNTYLNDGLPPGPICNPGIASLKAAINPSAVDYLYFFHTADGQTIFSRTLDEHNAKKSQYKLAI